MPKSESELVPLFWKEWESCKRGEEGHSSKAGIIVTSVLVSSTMWQAADQPKPFDSLSHSLILFFPFKYKLYYRFHFPSMCFACDFSHSVFCLALLTSRLQLYRWLQLHSLQISSAVFIQSDKKWKGELLTPLFCPPPPPPSPALSWIFGEVLFY